MAQSKVEALMQNYATMSPAERQEFRAMLIGYDLRGASAQGAGKKAAATRKSAQEKRAENRAAAEA
jgi:hypothetical protein